MRTRQRTILELSTVKSDGTKEIDRTFEVNLNTWRRGADARRRSARLRFTTTGGEEIDLPLGGYSWTFYFKLVADDAISDG
jgi:hypothetical protein